MMIEMAARLSGGDFSESLVPLGCGVNYVEAALNIAMGREPNWQALLPRFEKAVINRYFFLPPGELQAVMGVDTVRALPQTRKFELWVSVGEQIQPITSHGGRSGVFILVGSSHEEVQLLIDTVYRTVQFQVDGRWVTGHPLAYEGGGTDVSSCS